MVRPWTDDIIALHWTHRRARWKGNSSNAKALPPLQDGGNSGTGHSPSPPKVPLHRQSSKCLWATNAAAFDEEAAELEEREYLAALQKAHESLERESPEFMMAVAQLQAYRPIFIPPDRKAKIETARLGEGNAAGRAPGANDNEEIEQIVRRQHEEALKRLLAREAKAAPKSKGSGLREHKHSPEEGSAGKQLEKEEKTACKQVPQKEVAGWEPETTVSEQGVSGSVHNDGEHAAGAAPPDWRLAREKQEEAKAAATAARMSASSSHRLPAAATKATAAAAAAAPSSASRRRVNAVSSGDKKEPWKMWKLSASAGMEGGFALAPGEIPADGKPPSWKPFGSHGSLDPDLHIGSWASKESPAEDKPPPWKPVGPSSNLDHYSGSWGSKEPPPDEKPPVWKPVPPRNPDHYDGSWGSKSPEHSRSSAVFPDHWRPFWHSNPVDWSYLRPIDNVPEQKSKAKEPMWRL
ncbi:hypothetical protein DUNSADRAFT_10973 [Dunaliella salina]|uniref:Uncharacterized protein n=1 Tax=Dunaliella salina TaxID=3046 RepID=A0ABQ7GEC4_DUNSA|nr:hypothetical protein DUNSADRAFT_10973 [Dunaliella salina]|eukprot:KAF5832956.1 hypothetical protein DUNSADRAFT_10973 [Dunaliella salina]